VLNFDQQTHSLTPSLVFVTVELHPGGKKKLIWEVFMYGERAKENGKQNKLEIKLSVQLGVSEKTSSVH
jgi:hypothetical protein